MWKQFKYKLAITLTITIFAPIASFQPANAIDLEGFLKGLLDDIGLSEEYIKEFLDDVVGIFPETGAEIKTAIENETGALDLPDLNAVEKEISQDFANSGNLENLETAINIIEVEVVRANADSILGKDGQASSLTARNRVIDSVEEVQSLGEQANNETVTQNVMKRMATQNERIAQILGAVHSSNESLKVTTAYNSRISAELLEKQVEQQAEAEREQRNLNLTEIGVISTFEAYLGN